MTKINIPNGSWFLSTLLACRPGWPLRWARARRPGVIWQAAGVLILGVVCALAAVAWVYLVAGHGGFWRTDQRLPLTEGEPPVWPDVVAVVPARDEAGLLPATLPTLLAQDYRGSFEVVLVDDGSTDGTGEIAGAIGREVERGLRVITGGPPPEGWAGKVWAMAQGLEGVAGEAMSSGAAPTGAVAAGAGYVLFTDADIAWRPGALRRWWRRLKVMGVTWCRRWRGFGLRPRGSEWLFRRSFTSLRSFIRSGESTGLPGAPPRLLAGACWCGGLRSRGRAGSRGFAVR
jgi:cellulose synthase/poly-beta-1,6-N-acetylglucosamine synthase-like glycosyltransferase